MSSVVEIKNREGFEAFKKHRRCVVFYGAEWCDACKGIENLYARIATRYRKKIRMAHVDVDKLQLDFSKVPIFVTYRKGKVLNTMVGANKEGLKELVKEAIQAE